MDNFEAMLASCPVKPLGVRPHHVCWYKAAGGIEQRIDIDRHTRMRLIVLFSGDCAWLLEHFPLWSRPREAWDATIVDFDAQAAAEWLVGACARLGEIEYKVSGEIIRSDGSFIIRGAD